MLIAGLSDFLVGDLTDWVVDVIKAIGYLGVALLVAIESIFPPIPSEVVLPAAGLAASRGEANVFGMVVAATVGSVIGAWALYLIAAAIGDVRLHALVMRYGRWVGVKPRDLTRAGTPRNRGRSAGRGCTRSPRRSRHRPGRRARFKPGLFSADCSKHRDDIDRPDSACRTIWCELSLLKRHRTRPHAHLASDDLLSPR